MELRIMGPRFPAVKARGGGKKGVRGGVEASWSFVGQDGVTEVLLTLGLRGAAERGAGWGAGHRKGVG